MNEIEYLNEFYRHVGNDSILVVTCKGEIVRLYCPFRVASKVNFAQIAAGEIVWVQEVRITSDKQDVFIIDGSAYFVWYFVILTDPP